MQFHVLIIEDHPLFCDALKQLLGEISNQLEFTVTETAESGLEIAATLSRLDLILLDIGLPGMSGGEALGVFRQRFPQTPILVLSATESRREVQAVLNRGANAFISKSMDAETIRSIIQKALLNEEVNSPSSAHVPPVNTSVHRNLFTNRQRQVFFLAAKGYSSKEIGLRLDLAEVTVKLHLSTIYRILKVNNRVEAFNAARRLGIDMET